MPAENTARKLDQGSENSGASAEKSQMEIKDKRDKLRSFIELSNTLSLKEKAACMKWLNDDPASHDAKQLDDRIKHFEGGDMDKAVKKQEAKFREQIKEETDKELFAKKSEKEYVEWFIKDLTYEERDKYLREKNTTVHDSARKKTLKEYEDLILFFKDAPQADRAENKKNFLNKDLQERQKMVAELTKKKTLLEKSKLPLSIRTEIAGDLLSLNNAATEKLISDNLHIHKRLKTKFLSLPLLVQEEQKEEFKKGDFGQRAQLLEEVSSKMEKLSHSYQEKIQKMTQLNAKGLTLFSASSEKSYMDWFKKLSIKGMEAYLTHSDLDSPERKNTVWHMEEQLDKFPEKKRPGIIAEFNKADLDKRKQLLDKYAARQPEDEDSEKSGGLIRNLFRKLTSSEHDSTFNEKRRANFAADEIAKRMERARKITNSSIDTLGEKAEERGLHETVGKTDTFLKKIKDERLHKDDGTVKLNTTRLAHSLGDLHGVEAGLKQGIDKEDAMFATSKIELRNAKDDKVVDIQSYRRDTLGHERKELEAEAAQKIQEQMKPMGQAIDLKKIQEEIDRVWEETGKDTIRHTNT